MKKNRILILLFLAVASIGFSQEKLTDKELVNVIYAMGQMYPDGFTIDLNTMPMTNTRFTWPRKASTSGRTMSKKTSASFWTATWAAQPTTSSP